MALVKRCATTVDLYSRAVVVTSFLAAICVRLHWVHQSCRNAVLLKTKGTQNWSTPGTNVVFEIQFRTPCATPHPTPSHRLTHNPHWTHRRHHTWCTKNVQISLLKDAKHLIPRNTQKDFPEKFCLPIIVCPYTLTSEKWFKPVENAHKWIGIQRSRNAKIPTFFTNFFSVPVLNSSAQLHPEVSFKFCCCHT